MKKLVALVVLVPGLLLAADAKGPKPGFRDLMWGTERPDPENRGEWQFESGGLDEAWSRANEKMDVGPAKATQIQYHFFDEELWQVTIDFDPITTHDLADALTETWGKPVAVDRFKDEWVWTSRDKRLGVTTALLTLSRLRDDYSLIITSDRRFEAYMKARKKEAAGKAKGDL